MPSVTRAFVRNQGRSTPLLRPRPRVRLGVSVELTKVAGNEIVILTLLVFGSFPGLIFMMPEAIGDLRIELPQHS